MKIDIQSDIRHGIGWLKDLTGNICHILSHKYYYQMITLGLSNLSVPDLFQIFPYEDRIEFSTFYR